MVRLLLIVLLFIAGDAHASENVARPNVLLICVDDLRPQLGCDGDAYMRTPNIDRLAATGRLFRRHFVQVPTCGASRYSLLTGMRPDAMDAPLNNNAFARIGRQAMREPDSIESLPHLFRLHGYRTVMIGKVGHAPDGRVFEYDGSGTGEAEMPRSWDEMSGPIEKWGTAWNAFFAYADGSSRTTRRHETLPTPPTESFDGDDLAYPDGWTAAMAVEKLKELKAANRSFFLAVGFFKPHLPFNAPKRYWDSVDAKAIPAPMHAQPPEGVDRRISVHRSGELMGYQPPHDPRTDAAYAQHLRHAYAAAIHFTDAQVGKVLDALEESGLAQNTIVVLWGDHGWHLGELGMWGKHSLFDAALRSALIIRTPNMAQSGVASDSLVESLDLYPTLTELCGLPTPESIAGRSLRPVLDDPTATVRDAAFSYWRSAGYLGHAVRTDRYRLVRWFDPKTPAVDVQVELYDQVDDPSESKNIAADHPELVAEFRKRLRQWDAD